MQIKYFLRVLIVPILLYSCTTKPNNKAEDFFVQSNNKDSLRLVQINDSLKKTPQNIHLWIEMGEVSRKNYDYRSALDASAHAYALDSTNIKARALYAWALINKPNRTMADVYAAQRHFRYILTKEPNNPQTLIDLANTYALTGAMKPAFENINKALKIDKNYRDAYVLKGSIYKTMKKYDLALSSYQTAIQIDPNFFLGYLNTGWLLTEMKKHKLALEYYRSAAQIKPTNDFALYGIAKSLQDLKQYDEALKEYRHLAKVDSSFYITYFNQAYIKQYFQKQPDSAIYYYKKVLKVNDQYYQAWYQLGRVYYDLGQRGNAENAYTACLKLKSDFQPAIEAAKKLKTLN